MSILRVGTRTSQLALTQAREIAAQIVAACEELDDFEIVGITTSGDVNRAPLAEIGGTGLFTSAVREALIEGRCDIAVHSSKDLPAADHPQLEIFYPPRVNPSDVICAHVPFAQLPQGARVGTGSPRRAVQLRAYRPDLIIEQIRGNVPTRLARIDSDLDAVILARAGLSRLGITEGEDLPTEIMVPAAGQGALGVETVAGSAAAEFVRRVEDESTRNEVRTEREFMRVLGAGCTTPVGVLAQSSAGVVSVHGRYIDDSLNVDETATGRDPIALAGELAAVFLERGVGDGR